jgi:hypothetical protein
MLYRGPGAFLRLYNLAPSPLPQQVVSLSRYSCVSPVELTDGREGEAVGEGAKSNHTTARKPGPL